MAITPKQIVADLHRVYRGRLAFDPITTGLYSTDASPFQIIPLGVAIPEDEADLATIVRYAFDHNIPLIPRGAGTGLAGESLGPGLVLDLSVRFRRITAVSPETITAQAGVVCAELNAALAPHGRRFAPDPANAATCTVGGMVGTNASGGNSFRHGYTRDHVHSLRVMWDNGETAQVGKQRLRIQGDDTRVAEITSSVEVLLIENRDLIQLTRPATPFNRCGYLLHDTATPEGDVNLARLLVGSEGTLGIVTEATLATVPLAGATCVALLGFPSIDAAVRAGVDLRTYSPTGCDLLDRRLLAVSRIPGPGPGIGQIPAQVGSVLVVTFEAESESEAVAAAQNAISAIRRSHVLRVLAEPTSDPDGIARSRGVRDAAVAGLYGLGNGPRPVAFVEDVAVPAESLSLYLGRVQDVLKRSELTASFLIHTLTGQVHTRPLVDLADPVDRAKLWPLAEAVHGLALELGGTVSSQHGTGIARTPWVERQYGPIMPVYREIKRIFDPKNILNPGKIIGPDPSRPAWPLRYGHPSSRYSVDAIADLLLEPQPVDPVPAQPLVPLLAWPEAGMAGEAAKCNGCGECRTRTLPTRMCPVFHATGSEAATPRAKANLIRVMSDSVETTSDEIGRVAGLCVHCKMCKQECAARVDIPKLMLEAKAKHLAEHGMDRADWLLSRAHTVAAFGSNFAPLVNGLLAVPSVRWVLEKLFGISRDRLLPAFALGNFKRQIRGRALSRQPRPTIPKVAPKNTRVAYFVDTFATYNDPSIAQATVAVLRHNGIEVYVPPRQTGCGMAPLAVGDLESAREAAVRNVRALADLARAGYRVVCSEPTAAVLLTQEYLALLPDQDAATVAAATVELTAFLWELHGMGRLRTDFRRLDLSIGHHIPCHVKALPTPAAGPALLGLIPGLSVLRIDSGCSGMAGTWGLRAENLPDSLAAGMGMLTEMNRPRVSFGSTECSSCRLQMQHGSGKRTLHPVQYLAYAYGLMPEIGTRLDEPLSALVSD